MESIASMEQQWEDLVKQEKTRNSFVEELFATIRRLIEENKVIDAENRNYKFNQFHHLEEREMLKKECESLKNRLQAGPFVAVLVDGDNTLFLDKFVRDGADGGHRAAKKLQEAVQTYLEDLLSFQAHWRIVVRIYANVQGLISTYAKLRVTSDARKAAEYLVGFNRELPLFEFVDVGADKEAADNKIKENLNLYWMNEHCKHVLLAGSADRSYVSFLRQFCEEEKLKTKLTLVKSVPFPPDFEHLATWFHNTSFKNVFRKTKLVSTVPGSGTPSLSTYANTAALINPVERRHSAAISAPNLSAVSSSSLTRKIQFNRHGQRIDEKLHPWNDVIARQLRQMSLCPRHFLTQCNEHNCPQSHDGALDEEQKRALMRIARDNPCGKGTHCSDRGCVSAHHCLYDGRCDYGFSCKYGPEMHEVDKTISVVR
ncbi:hypothetical protein CKM354_000633500 [Cercospora kikuchii]|uniref:C3H1-type domain-containing protein n=1 Tax=Cercospora kikuchii TaxID=84275 RepID=A0A9P3FHP6_9PEZI|nr:uncharacterized protein CKM354_000633500 [Cercospora kikuchii]GIZ43094.1 hypothetical protein CKM354_000633500 [Cercospora kikuchii]